jgi:hypothetical protein
VNCRSARARIDAAVDGTAAIESVLELEAHAAACAECRALLMRARRLEEALSRLDDPASERVDVERSLSSIARAIDGAEAERSARPTAWRLVRWTGLAAAAVILLALAVWNAVHETDLPPGSTPGQELAAGEPVPPSAPLVADPTAAIERDAGVRTDPSDALDTARLAEVRTRARELLLLASDRLPSESDPAASADGLALRIDELTRDLARGGWPIVRMVEASIDDRDPRIARTAVRYLGLRGDRLSVAAIKRASVRSELEVSALFALIDAGEAGSECVQSAIKDGRLRRPVLDRLIARGTADSARGLEKVLRGTPRRNEVTVHRSDDLETAVLEALAEIGERGVPSLLHLASEGTVSFEASLAALEHARGAADALARLLEEHPRDYDPDLCLQAVRRLACTPAIAFVEAQATDAQRKPQAIDVLASLGGKDALKALFRLRVADSTVAPVLSRTLAGDGRAARDLALEWTELGQKRDLKVLCDALFENDSSGPPSEAPSTGALGAAPALILLAGSDLISSSDRRWAVLLAGEVGQRADSAPIEDLLRRQSARDKELRAACLIAIRSLTGPDHTARVLAWASPQSSARIQALLDGRDARGKPASTLFKIARELEPVLTPPNP